MPQALRNLAQLNGRFAPSLAQTMLASPRAAREVNAFRAHVEAQGFEFTTDWVDNNIPYIAPVLRRFADEQAAAGRPRISYLEIGAYEGRNLAFYDWLLPGRFDATVIDPWFDEALNPEEKYHAVEPRFQRNAAKIGLPSLTVRKGFSTYELPRMLEAEEAFDLVYIDGSHTAWAVMTDLCYCAALLRVGGLVILDDYWQDDGHGGPGAKPAVDRFHGMFKDYFEVEAVYRQVVLRKTAELPR